MSILLSAVGRLLVLAVLGNLFQSGTAPGDDLPPFGRDTVLVYRNSTETDPRFVVRIAEFSPDRYIEWENVTTQGTVWMGAKGLEEGREFVSWRLFQAGVDTTTKSATVLWLSAKTFRTLKGDGKAKINLDSIPTWLTLVGKEALEIEINRARKSVSVIRTIDERKNERWFLDLEQNPLMVRYAFRDYVQSLESITTDRANTLRWIKDRKLKKVPQREPSSALRR